jgi:hypothetical protein
LIFQGGKRTVNVRISVTGEEGKSMGLVVVFIVSKAREWVTPTKAIDHISLSQQMATSKNTRRATHAGSWYTEDGMPSPLDVSLHSSIQICNTSKE